MRDFGNGAIVLGNAINRDHPLCRGMTGWWEMRRTFGGHGGKSLQNLHNLRNGNVVSPAIYSGNSLALNGTSGNANIAYNWGTLSNFTVVADIKLASSGESSLGRVAEDASAFLLLMNSGAMQFSAGGSGTSQYVLPSYNTRFSVGGVHRANKPYIFHDGVNKATAGTASAATASGTIYLGNRAADDRTMNGVFYSFQFWARALSDGEMVQLYNESRRGYPTMLNRLSPLRTFYFGTAAGAPPSSTFDVIGGGCGQFMIGAD